MAKAIISGHLWSVEVDGQLAMPFFPLYSLVLAPFTLIGSSAWYQVLLANGLIIGAICYSLYQIGWGRRYLLLPFISFPISSFGLLAWSENLSLPLVMIWAIAITSVEHGKEQQAKVERLMAIVLALLVVTRLANIIFIPLSLFVLFAKEVSRVQMVKMVVPAVLLLLCLFVVNYLATGHVLGYQRLTLVDISTTPIIHLITEFVRLLCWYIPSNRIDHNAAVFILFGIVGGLTAYRTPIDYRFKLVLALLYLLIGLLFFDACLKGWLVIQAMVVALIVRFVKFRKPDQFLLLSAFIYLLWLLFAERMTELDQLDTRLMSPVMILLWVGFLPKPLVTYPLKSAQASAS